MPMETIPVATLVKSKSSNSAITKLGTRGRKTSKSSAEMKKMESKKRGVYVEKWENPKLIYTEDNKRQLRARTQPKSRPQTTQPTSAVVEAELSSFTRLLSAPDPALARELYKPLSSTVSPTTRVPKQQSKMSNIVNTNKNQHDIKPQRNIIERNKKQAKMKKFRSNVLRQAYSRNSEKVITFKSKKDIIVTSSKTLKLTRDLSDDAHWSHIFPNDPQSGTSRYQLQNHISNYESTSKKASESSKSGLNRKKDDDKINEDGKDENIYNFFIDLLETVYDDNFDNSSEKPTLTIVHSGDSSKINLEIEESVAQKLYLTEESERNMKNTARVDNSNRYTIKDDDNETVDQSQMLADYYNNRGPLMPHKTIRRPRKVAIKKIFTYSHKPAYSKPEVEVTRKKPKKLNLLNLLKEQLAIDCNTYEEPENMYQALCTIARNKNKYRQIRFDTPEKESKSDYEGVCRFKRRKVISPSTRLPRKGNILRSDYDSNNTTGARYFRESEASIDTESNHSLEVFGYDYEKSSNVELDSEQSDSDRITRKYVRSITNLNQGIKTITQYWKL